MNKKLRDILITHQIHPKSYQKKKNVYIVSDGSKVYVIKLNTNNYDIYKYLLSRDFLYFPNNYSDIDDDYDLMEFIDDLLVTREQKINDYVHVLAILHYKTSYKREIDLDEIKEKYEGITNRLTYLQNYYHNLNNMIDKESFLSPAMYLLVRNISLIYKILEKSLISLNKIYSNVKNEKSIRVSLIHNNIDLSHLINNNHIYLISWDKARFDIPIYELEVFFRKYYRDIEISDFLKEYNLINKLSLDEEKLLLILLAIPQELSFTNNTYLDTKTVNDEIDYLNKVYELLKIDKNE